MATIGFVGLGHMGFPMASNLLKHGHKVIGFDLQKEAVNLFASIGGIIANDISEVTVDTSVIFTMLQTGDQVKGVLLGENGLFSKAKKETLFIDCSTIDVASTRDCHLEAATHGMHMLDAPVSGGVSGAAMGALTFMVGGYENLFDLARSLLEAMGKTLIYTGPAGSGQAAKICNNMILGISMIGISEAFNLAKGLGLSDEKLFEVVTHASGQCWAMNHYVPVPNILPNVPANSGYMPGFSVAMMLKDLNLSQHCAHDAKVTTPLGAKATQLYQQFNDEGQGGLDFSAIIKL